MNQPSPSVTDAIGLGVFIASLVYSPEVAEVVGPYIVIILASVIGASFAVRRAEKTTRLAAAGYFLRVAGLAVLVTVSISAFLGSRYAGWTERTLITPVALIIGAIGDDWPQLRAAIVRLIFSTIETFRPKGGGK